MAMKGYLKPAPTAGELTRGIAQLERSGVSTEDIVICESPEALLESLGAGDTLVIGTSGELGGLRRTAALLRAASLRGVSVRLLEEGIDTSAPVPDWAAAAELFSRIDRAHRSQKSRAAVFVARQSGHKGIGRSMDERTRRALKSSLRRYYSEDDSVREICTQEGLDASVLYRWIERNGLPRRENIAANPLLNPFRGGRALRVRLGDEDVVIAPRGASKRRKEEAVKSGNGGKRRAV